MNLLIDPGHGGSDSGCTGNALLEKEVNLVLGLSLAAVARAHGITVTMTRTTDITLALSQRVPPGSFDLTLAIHCDTSSDPLAGDLMPYVKQGDGVGYNAALSVVHAAPWQLSRHEKKVIPALPTGWTHRAYNVLHLHRGPALLVETCFLSNSDHTTFIGTSRGKASLVDCMMAGVLSAWHAPGVV